MLIVNFEEFIQYQEGTVFSFYEPCITRDLCIKHNSIYHEEKACDFFYESLLPEVDPLTEIPEFPGITRWGEFNYHQHFIIYEYDDVHMLKNSLR